MAARVTQEAWLVTTGAVDDPAVWQEALAGMASLRESGLAARLLVVAAAGAADAAELPFDGTIVECEAFGPVADSRMVRDAVELVAAERGRPAVLAAVEGDVAVQGLARLAASWGAALVAGVRSWRWAGGFLSVVREGVGGQGNERIAVELAGVHVLALSRSFGAVGRPAQQLPVAAVERLALGGPSRDATPLRMIDTEPPIPDMTRAPIVVAGGLGLGSASAVDLVRDLADALGGAVGGTRPIVDLGWLPQDRLIGATGRAIVPDLYVALGISGATQHVSSIRARKVLSVNIDPAAAMTRLADLGLVGDVHEVVPALAMAIREYRR